MPAFGLPTGFLVATFFRAAGFAVFAFAAAFLTGGRAVFLAAGRTVFRDGARFGGVLRAFALADVFAAGLRAFGLAGDLRAGFAGFLAMVILRIGFPIKEANGGDRENLKLYHLVSGRRCEPPWIAAGSAAARRNSSLHAPPALAAASRIRARRGAAWFESGWTPRPPSLTNFSR